jgi:hypothetical protein
MRKHCSLTLWNKGRLAERAITLRPNQRICRKMLSSLAILVAPNDEAIPRTLACNYSYYFSHPKLYA